MSDVIENEHRRIGRAYFHTGNSGLSMEILDKGFGPTMVWTVSSMSMTHCSFEINVDPSVFEHMMWLAIGAATNPNDYPRNILDPSNASIEFGNHKAALLYDYITLISPTGKIKMGYKADPNLRFYIEGKSHGVPSFDANIDTTRVSFVSLAKLFYKAMHESYSPTAQGAYITNKEPDLSGAQYKLDLKHNPDKPSRREEALARLKTLIHTEKALGG